MTGALTLLVYALMTKTFGLLVPSAVLVAAFVAVERRAAQPLVPFAILTQRNLTGRERHRHPRRRRAHRPVLLHFALHPAGPRLRPAGGRRRLLPLAIVIGASAGLAGSLATRFGGPPVLIAAGFRDAFLAAAGIALLAALAATLIIRPAGLSGSRTRVARPSPAGPRVPNAPNRRTGPSAPVSS